MFKSSYIPKYFKAQELVSPEYYEIWGEDEESRVENFDKTPNWCHIEFTTDLVFKTYFFNP